MTHLTAEQLSALHDGALPPAELAAAQAHVEQCEGCRTEFASLASLDASLDSALAFDPGEPYFADFASRVQARIAAEAAEAAPTPVAPVRAVRAAPKRGTWFAPRAFGFAGAAAALVVTAGLAWMMFGRSLAPGELMRSDAPAAGAADQRAESERAPLGGAPEGTGPVDAATPQASSVPPAAADRPEPARRDDAISRSGVPARMRAIEPPSPRASAPTAAALEATSEDAQVAPPPAAASAPTPVSAPRSPRSEEALFKERVAAPAGKATAQSEAAAEQRKKSAANTLWGTTRSLLGGEQKPGTSAPSLAPPAGLKDGSARGLALSPSLDRVQPAVAIEPPCGIVRDTRGTPLRGAQLTLLGATTRTSRSGPDGTFCLEQPMAGDTLVVLRVGFEPVRLVLVSSAALALALEPVGTLGSHDGLVTGRGDASGSARELGTGGLTAPRADVYDRENAKLRDAVSGAREAAAIATRERTPEAWERAAERWRGIAAATAGAASYDASFRELSALREALTLSPTAERVARFKRASAAFVAGTPRTLPERATVQRWTTEVRRYSTYR